MYTMREIGRVWTLAVSPEDPHDKLSRKPYKCRALSDVFLRECRAKPTSSVRGGSVCCPLNGEIENHVGGREHFNEVGWNTVWVVSKCPENLVLGVSS